MCFSMLPSLCSTPRKFSADCEVKGSRTKEGKAGGEGGRRGGDPRSCKLSAQMEETSDLAFSHNGGSAHSVRSPPLPRSVQNAALGSRCLDPAVGLLGHSDLQLLQHPKRAFTGPRGLLDADFVASSRVLRPSHVERRCAEVEDAVSQGTNLDLQGVGAASPAPSNRASVFSRGVDLQASWNS